MAAAEDPNPWRAELSAVRREIEQVHAEVHELADRIDDLEAAWAALPTWLRWLMRLPPRR